MKNKFWRVLAAIISILLVAVAALWLSVNYIIIPKIIVPKVQEYINSYQDGAFRLFIKKITFNPFTGFKLEDVNFSGNTAYKDNTILTAKTVDIDLLLLALLKQKIKIKGFDMSEVSLKITRYANGNWNFQALLDIFEEQGGEGVDFEIDEVDINDGKIYYGDYTFCGNIKIENKKGFFGSELKGSVSQIKFTISENVIIDSGIGMAVITKDEINIESFEGEMQDNHVSCHGIITLTKPEEIYLTGKIGDLNNSFQLKVLNENQGTAYLETSIGNSYIKMHANISDLEKLFFTANLEGDIQLLDLFLATDKIEGRINFSGTIKRESEGEKALEEELLLRVEDFSIFGLKPLSFNFNLDIKNGVLVGNIPQTGFYKGSLRGDVKMDFARWGAELHIDSFDMCEFSKVDPKLEGIKGIFNGNISLVSGWDDFNTVKGGGYFQFNDCYLWDAPVFKQTIEGVNTVVKDTQTPDFTRLEGNFKIGEKNITVDYVYADVSPLKLNIKGKITLQGSVNFTVGVMLSSGSIFRSIRQIFLPGTILFDVVANCIEVDIYNTWEDLKYNVGIQPSAFITAIFPGVHNKPIPNKYSLEQLWSPQKKEVKKQKPASIKPRKKN